MAAATRAATGALPSVSALPPVTIVVATWRRADTLRALLESVGRLEYPKELLELVVVGTPSDPGRGEVERFAREAGFPVTYRMVPEEADASASLKRNEGVSLAAGDIIAFTDDDCVVDSRWLAGAVPLFADPRVGGVEGAVRIPVPERPTMTSRGSQRLSPPGGYQTCNMFYRRAVFLECGGFDLTFPFYLEDTDMAYSVIERGYRIPFADGAAVTHPVQPGRPLKLLTVARSVGQMPYLFAKHGPSASALRSRFRPFGRSHYFYLGLYGLALALVPFDLRAGAVALGLGLGTMLPLHLAWEFRGLHFTWQELALTALCQPVVAPMRLFHWIKGNLTARSVSRR